MTAINILLMPKVLHIFSDGVSNDAEGRIVGISSKVFAFPHIKTVIGVRGSSGALPLLAHSMAFHSSDFDHLTSNAVAIFRRAISEHNQIFQQSPDGTTIQMIAAGLSPKTGNSAAIAISNFDDPDGKIDSVADAPPQTMFAPGGPDFDGQIEAVRMMYFMTITRWEDLKLEEFGIRLMQTQRQIVKTRNRREGCIGGFVQLTSVTDQAITSRIIHRWPEDVIGNNFFT